MSPLTEEVSIKALSFVVVDEDRAQQFFNVSGMSPNDLKASAGSAETWAALLDFILSDDNLVMTFCQEQGLTVEEVWKVRNNLPGSPASACISV